MIHGTTLVAGHADGLVYRTEPLSFWGGYDPVKGRVIDRSHSARGQPLGGRVLVMRSGRGSSSSSSVLAEALRLGTAPLAILLCDPDPIITTGSIVAGLLYGSVCPVILLSPTDHDQLVEGARVEIRGRRAGAPDATVRVVAAGEARTDVEEPSLRRQS